MVSSNLSSQHGRSLQMTEYLHCICSAHTGGRSILRLCATGSNAEYAMAAEAECRGAGKAVGATN